MKTGLLGDWGKIFFSCITKKLRRAMGLPLVNECIRRPGINMQDIM